MMSTSTHDLEPHDLVDEQEAAQIMERSPRTLQRWRREGYGPAFVRFGGQVRYSRRGVHLHLQRLADKAFQAELAKGGHRGN
jgi:hypothetical protein